MYKELLEAAERETQNMSRIFTVDENIEKMDYLTMQQGLWAFAEAQAKYVDYVYTDAALTEEMELLSREQRAGVWAMTALTCEPEDWRTKLDCLKRAAKEWPRLGNFVKKYAMFVGQEVEAML